MIDLALEALTTSGLTYVVECVAVVFILVYLVSNFRSAESVVTSLERILLVANHATNSDWVDPDATPIEQVPLHQSSKSTSLVTAWIHVGSFAWTARTTESASAVGLTIPRAAAIEWFSKLLILTVPFPRGTNIALWRAPLRRRSRISVGVIPSKALLIKERLRPGWSSCSRGTRRRKSTRSRSRYG